MKEPNGLYSVNFLGRLNNKKGDLVNFLNELHKNLSTLSQEIEDRPKGLSNTSTQLISPKLLQHNDKEVRLLAACCLVDVLRVYAPEAPFSDGKFYLTYYYIYS